MGVLIYFEVQLAENDFVELLEDAILRGALILLVFALHNLVHAVEVLLELDFVDNEVGVALLIELLVLPGHVHVLDLIVQQETRRRLLKADHVLRQRLPRCSVKVLREILD